ncbi:hypothetical protein [Erythrobacter sp. JK5]|uniref:hypothetical protein n=1 Tax=Erythrobacter sp. JK5 TaxID=2829500 RepID=UPI001BAE3FCE|nr:hypothetical protein [Erythrobacter sp. JK5]QUL36494.1 hypothetical protein KDC96_08525 [Erythrobacter sp. JK5]
MSNWYRIPPSFRITEREYRANIDGMNIVFGAVLGFVLVGAENVEVRDFIGLLMLSAAIVILILYLGSSEYKLFNATITAVSIAFLPYISVDLFDITEVPKLQPTLAIWALMVLGVELIPRAPSHDRISQEKDQ